MNTSSYCPDELVPTRLHQRGRGGDFIKTSWPCPPPHSAVKSWPLSVRASQSLLGALTETATDLETASKGLFVDSNGAHVLPLKSTSQRDRWIPRHHFHSSQRPRRTVEWCTASHRWKKINVFISTGTCLAVVTQLEMIVPIRWVQYSRRLARRRNECACWIKTPDSVRQSFLYR